MRASQKVQVLTAVVVLRYVQVVQGVDYPGVSSIMRKVVEDAGSKSTAARDAKEVVNASQS